MISVSVCISRWSWSRRVPVADRRWISSYSPLCSASYSTKKIIRKIVIPWFFILKQFHLINSLILIHLFALSHIRPRILSSFFSQVFEFWFWNVKQNTITLDWVDTTCYNIRNNQCIPHFLVGMLRKIWDTKKP